MRYIIVILILVTIAENTYASCYAKVNGSSRRVWRFATSTQSLLSNLSRGHDYGECVKKIQQVVGK
jgi:hypothetical protein